MLDFLACELSHNKNLSELYFGKQFDIRKSDICLECLVEPANMSDDARIKRAFDKSDSFMDHLVFVYQ